MKSYWTTVLLCLAAAAHAASDLKERPTMNDDHMPAPSRPAPPRVPAIEHDGVRYMQDMDPLRHGGDQPTGYLVAVDPGSGNRLWMLKVYRVPDSGSVGVPSFGRYFKRMTLLPADNAIEIENEVGGVYRVNLAARIATWVSGPDSKP